MYQDIIYNSNGSCSRNSTTRLPNTSSDICIYEIPFFQMTGASKIDCSEVTCDISGISYNDIYTATTECFTINDLSGTCFDNIVWETRVLEDDDLVYSATFFTSTALTGSSPTLTNFSGSVVTAFNTLGYDYSFSGTQYTLYQKGFNNLKLQITTDLNLTDDCTSCECPSGFTATPANDDCQRLTFTSSTTGATFISGATGDVLNVYDQNGAVFLPNVSDYTWPLKFSGSPNQIGAYSGTNFVVDATSTVVPALVGGPGSPYFNKPQVKNALWGQGFGSSGRMNNAGIKSTPRILNEFIGFTSCVDINTAGTYYVGVGADDEFKVSLNGDLIFSANTVTLRNPYTTYSLAIQHFWVLELDLKSGKNIFQLEYLDVGSNANLTCEIYSGTSIQQLSGFTTEAQLSAVTLFTTADEVNELFDLAGTSGFTCPTGFVLDTCSGTTSTCVKIEKADKNCTSFTGSCSGVTEVICDLDFSGLTSGSTNVYPLTGQTSIDLDFTFTANTKSLTGNTEFLFEIYKYNKDLGVFTQPSIYQSRAFTWNEFSGTSAFTTSVPVSNLSIDGDYLVKGYYNYDICTEILSLLGEKRNTAQYKYGDKYSLYKQDRDFHFVAFTSAETPFLNPANPIAPELNAFTISSFIVNEGQTDYNIQTAQSDYLISLNGLTLSKNLDYSISSNTLTTVLKLSATTVPGDIITYAFLNSTTDNSAIRLDVFDITSPIVSGATDGQGSNNVYYNTTKGKYEIYASVTPSNANDIVVNLNGVTLANNIDYYLSTSNPKRIILEGNLVVGDILNLYYVSNTDAQGDIDTTSIGVNWSIDTPPQLVNGEFIVELADDENFTNIITTGKTDYVVGSTNYAITLNLTGSVGDVQYYRVKNIKKYEDICGNLIETTAYSEIIDITIQTNAINSY
jgi:hypothetical protein